MLNFGIKYGVPLRQAIDHASGGGGLFWNQWYDVVGVEWEFLFQVWDKTISFTVTKCVDDNQLTKFHSNKYHHNYAHLIYLVFVIFDLHKKKQIFKKAVITMCYLFLTSHAGHFLLFYCKYIFAVVNIISCKCIWTVRVIVYRLLCVHRINNICSETWARYFYIIYSIDFVFNDLSTYERQCFVLSYSHFSFCHAYSI